MTTENETVAEAKPADNADAANLIANVVGDNGKVLNQDEIDSLLGFDSTNKEDYNTGIQAMLDKAL